MKEKYKVTQEHFALYRAECKKWQEIFGLKGWEPYFEHKKDDDGNMAWFNCNLLGRTVTFGLAFEWNVKPTTHEIKKTAFHEVCELFVYRFRLLGESRFVREDEFIEEEHNIVRTLEHILFDKW